MFAGARLKLTLWYACILACILAVAGLVTYLTVADRLRANVDEALQEQAAVEMESIREHGFPRPDRPFPAREGGRGRFRPRSADVLVYYTDGSGQTVAEPSGPKPTGLPVVQQSATAPAAVIRSIETPDGRFRVLTQPLAAGGRTLGYLQLAKSEEPNLDELRQLATILAATWAGGLALTVAGGYLLTGRTLAPIRAAMQRQREFVADASHELRTPLTLLRANTEVALRSDAPDRERLLRESLGDIDHMSALVNDLLVSARIDAGALQVARDPVDLGALARDVTGALGAVAGDAGVNLRPASIGAVIVEGDETRLRQLLTILLDNAIRYNRPGGSVDVSLREGHGHAELEIRDTGVGIPSHALPRLFDRFFRGDSARTGAGSGTGLGLSIARGIVEAHRGRIQIESAENTGTTVRVTLPLAQAG